ncbi:hypothetical protein D3C87_1942060 [compost metagenome]
MSYCEPGTAAQLHSMFSAPRNLSRSTAAHELGTPVPPRPLPKPLIWRETSARVMPAGSGGLAPFEPNPTS